MNLKMEVDSEEFPIHLLYYDRPSTLSVSETYSNIINPYQDSKFMNTLERDTWTLYGKSPELSPNTTNMFLPNQFNPRIPVSNEFWLNPRCDDCLIDGIANPTKSQFYNDIVDNEVNKPDAFVSSLNKEEDTEVQKIETLEENNELEEFNVNPSNDSCDTIPITKVEFCSNTEDYPIFFPNKQKIDETLLSSKILIDQNCLSSNASTKDESDNLSETSNPTIPCFNDSPNDSHSPNLSSNIICNGLQETQEFCQLNLNLRNLVTEVCESNQAIVPKKSTIVSQNRIAKSDNKKKPRIKKSLRRIHKKLFNSPIKAKPSTINPHQRIGKALRLSTNLALSKTSSTPTTILTRHRTRSGLKPLVETDPYKPIKLTNLKASTKHSTDDSAVKNLRARTKSSKSINDNPQENSLSNIEILSVCNKKNTHCSKKTVKKSSSVKRSHKFSSHPQISSRLKKPNKNY